MTDACNVWMKTTVDSELLDDNKNADSGDADPLESVIYVCEKCQHVATSQQSYLEHLKQHKNVTNCAQKTYKIKFDETAQRYKSTMCTQQRSPIWQHFAELNESCRTKCLICGACLSVPNKSTSPLIRHLLKKHPKIKLNKNSNKLADADSKQNQQSKPVQQLNPAEKRQAIEDSAEIWQNFEKQTHSSYVKCLLCGVLLTAANNSTCSLSRHMTAKHSKKSIERRKNQEKQQLEEPSADLDLKLTAVLKARVSKSNAQIWQHFAMIKGSSKAKCLLCGNLISVRSSSGPLVRHMSTKHAVILEECDRVAATTAEELQEQQEPQPKDEKLMEECVNMFSWRNQRKKQRSPIWQHFMKTNKPGMYKCRTCKALLAIKNSSTSPLVRHWHKKHGKMQLKTRANLQMHDSDSSDSMASEPSAANDSQQSQQQTHMQLLRMLLSNFQPFQIVEQQHFRKLCQMLNFNYQLPSVEMLQQTLMPSLYAETLTKVKANLRKADFICLSTQQWRKYCLLTAHFLCQQNELHTNLCSHLLGHFCVPNNKGTAQQLLAQIQQIAQDYQIEHKICAVVLHEHTMQLKEAVDMAGWSIWHCFAHELNVMLKAALSTLQPLFLKIHNLNADQHILDEIAFQFNFDLLRSAQSLQHDDWSNADASACKGAFDVLAVFNTIFEAMRKEPNMSISCIIIFCKQIGKHLNAMNNNKCLQPMLQNLLKSLQKDFEQKFAQIEDNELAAQATLLDPRFKKLGFSNEHKCQEAIENLYAALCATCKNEEPETTNTATAMTSSSRDFIDELFSDFDNATQCCSSNDVYDNVPVVRAELNKYFDEPLLQRKNQQGVLQNPLIWWHQRRLLYPHLYRFMQQRLCIMANAVPDERLSSTASQCWIENHQSFPIKNCAEFIFLHYNLKDA